jgi:4-amino-4-deoxy-L-arabinose transferase-like glycosyltransferase
LPSVGLLLALLFLTLSLPFLATLGIQNDEALFAGGVFPPYVAVYSAKVFGHEVPLMLMSYVGAVKAWLYKGIFALFDPSPWSVRLPMILLGAGTVWFFYDLLRRLAGPTTAAIGGLLLATDASFVLTRRYDWGPVAIGQFLAVGGVWSLHRFAETNRRRYVFAGFAAFGLGLWDKALFLWLLAGLGVAAMLFARGFLRKLCQPRNLIVALAAFCMGSYPLLRYNVSRQQATFRGNVQFVMPNFAEKGGALTRTLDGTILFGWATRDAPQEPIPSAGFWLFAAAAFAIPFFYRRELGFSIVCFAVIWILMLFNKDNGGAAHHTILLWPLPAAVVALGLGSASQRWGAAVPFLIAGAAAISSIVVLGQFYRDVEKLGGARSWTDATYALAQSAQLRSAEVIYHLDWGLDQTLHLLSRGTLPQRGRDRVSDDAIREAGAVFLRWSPGNEYFPGGAEKLDERARALGYTHKAIGVFFDRHERPMVELFRYRHSPMTK